MEKNLAKNYDPRDFEERIYEMWESKDVLRPRQTRIKNLLL